MGENEIPTPPIIYRGFSRIRELLTPKQTVPYLLIEHFIFLLVTSGVLFTVGGFDIMIPASTGLFFALVVYSIVHTALLSRDNWDSEADVMRDSVFQSFLLIVVSSVPIFILWFITTFDFLLYLIAIIALYILSVYARGEKFKGQRDFYIYEGSDHRELWYNASVSLEQAINHYESGNSFRGYYWSDRAMKEYEELVEKEERFKIRKAASHMATVAQFIGVASFLDDFDLEQAYMGAIEDSISRAGDAMSERICDSCGAVEDIEHIEYGYAEDEEFIFCRNCQYSSQEEYEEHINEEDLESDSGPDKSIEEACEVLGLEQPIESTEKVNEAYREKVLEVHPDTGGSNKEFIKVKESRDVLLDYLS